MSISTILCVDDERNVLLTLRAQLSRHFPHCCIEIAESAAEALELVDELLTAGGDVPLVIADQIMPDMKGDAFLIELHTRHPDILKVMLTGQASAEEVGNVVNRGSLYRFIAKPWNETDLCLTVTEALRCYQQEQQLVQQQVALEQANQDLTALNADLDRQVQDRIQQLRRSEQQLRHFVEHTPVAVAMFDRQMNYLVTSQRWLEDHHLDGQSLIGKCHYDIFPDLPDDWREAHQRGIRGSVECGKQDIYIRPDGQREWVRWEVHPWYESENIIGGIIVFCEVITDRIQTEINLQASEERFRQAFEYAAIGMGLVAPDGHWIRVNQSLCNLIGYTESELLGSTFQEITHPDDLETDLRYVQQMLAGEIPNYQMEKRYFHKQGHIVWILLSVSLVRDGEGEPLHFISQVQDITARKQAEIQLRQNEELLRLTLEFAGIGAWSWQPATGHYRWNGKTEELLDLPEGLDNLPQVWRDRIHADDIERVEAHIQQALTTGEAFIEEYRYRLLDGRYVWRWFMGQGMYTETGDLEQLLGVVQDIDERKQLEADLQQSQAFLRSIYESTEVSISVLEVMGDGNYRYLDANPATTRLAGVETSFLSNKTIADLQSLLPSTDYAQLLRHCQECVATQQSVQFENATVIDGQEMWWLTNVNPLINAQGNVQRLIISAIPITDRKQAELALQEREARLQRLAVNVAGVLFQYVLYADGTDAMTYISPKCREFYELEAEDILQDAGLIWAIIHPEDVKVAQQALLQSAQSLETFDLEFRIVPASGQLKWLRGVAQPERQSNGDIVWDGFVLEVTDRKRAEAAIQQLNEELEQRVQQRTEELARSEQDLRTIFNHVYDALFIHDFDGTVLDVNDRALELYGATREQLLGLSVPELSAPDAPTEALPELFRRAQTGESLRVEWQAQRLNKLDTFAVEVSLNQVTLGNRPIIIAGVRDISDRKRIEAELAESEAKFRRLVEGIKDVIWSYDANGNFTYLSPQFQTLSGWDPGEWLGKSVADLIHPDDRPESFSQGYSHALEFRHPHREGHYVWASINGTSIFDAEGNFIGAQGILSDISDRKQAEIALQESQRFLQTVIDTFPLVVFWKDRQSVYLGCNRKATEACGLDSPKDIVGKTDYDMPWAGTEAELYRADDRQVMDSGQAKLGIIETQLKADGSQIWIETNKLPLYNLQGEMVGLLGTYQDITERKQAEAALRDSEERFRVTFEQAAFGMVQVNLEGCYIQVNQKFCDIVGYSAAELYLRSYTEITHPDDLAADEARFHSLLSGESASFVMEKRYVRQEGDLVWATLAVSLVRNIAGEPQYFIGVIQDISERKRAEQQLQSEQLRLQLALEAADMGTWESDLETGFWSERTEAIFGYAPGEFPGDRDSFLNSILPEDREYVQQALIRGFETQSSYTIDYRINRLDGELRWVSVRGKVVPKEDGTSLRMVGVALDITERKQAEEALRYSEERLRLALMAAHQGLYDLNLKTGEAVVNSEYALMLGYDPAEFKETYAQWIERLHPDDRAGVIHAFQAYVAGETPEFKVEFRQRMKNEAWKWILSMGRIFAWDGLGEPLRILGTQTDISDRKQAEAERETLLHQLANLNHELEQANQQLANYSLTLEQKVEERTAELRTAQERIIAQEKLASLGTLTAGIAHELSNPLNFIKNYSEGSVDLSQELVETLTPVMPGLAGATAEAVQTLIVDLQENATTIQQQSQRAAQIIESMMQHTHADYDQVAPQPIHLHELLNQAFKLAYHSKQAQSYDFNLSVQKDYAPTVDIIDAIPSNLIRAMINLIENACDAMLFKQDQLRADAPTAIANYTPMLVIATRDSGDRVEIRIRDNGSGIEPEIQPKILDPFFTTKPPGKGTGLGLSLTYDIIAKQHQGTLTFESEPGEFTEVTISLPTTHSPLAVNR